MAWRKSSPELIALFDRLVPADPAVERRPMFGYPGAFLGGNLFASLFEENVVLRLSDSDRDIAKERYGAASFEPVPGRPMRAFVVAPARFMADERLLCAWIARAMDFARTLPAKRKKIKKAKKAARPAAQAARPRAKGTRRPARRDSR